MPHESAGLPRFRLSKVDRRVYLGHGGDTLGACRWLVSGGFRGWEKTAISLIFCAALRLCSG